MSKFNEILQRHHQMVAELERKKKEMAKEVQENLKEGFKDFFDLVPEAKSIVWTQYTPYFNDGDECIFRVNDYEVHETENPDYQYGDGGIKLEKPSNIYYVDQAKNPNGWGASAVKEWNETLERLGGKERLEQITEAKKLLDNIFNLPDDFFKDTFNNHVTVVATRNGFDVDDFDHD